MSTNTAIIITDEKGIEFNLGPKCAVNLAGKKPSNVPDFTKGAFKVLDVQARPKKLTTEKANGDATSRNLDPQIVAFQYLRLRAECLNDFDGSRYDKLVEMYKVIDGDVNKLEHNDVRYLINLMVKSKSQMPLLAMTNLLACYSYIFWIRAGKAVRPESSFLSVCEEYLKTNTYLTIKQIKTLNDIFRDLEGFTELNERAFVEAIKLDKINRPYQYSKKG